MTAPPEVVGAPLVAAPLAITVVVEVVVGDRPLATVADQHLPGPALSIAADLNLAAGAPTLPPTTPLVGAGILMEIRALKDLIKDPQGPRPIRRDPAP